MKRVIRHGVFETNSSSMHSIVVTKYDMMNKPTDKEEDAFLGHGNKLIIWGSDLEFGRSPFEVLATPERKLHYAIASILSGAVYGHITEEGNCDDYLSAKLNEFDELAMGLFKGCKGIEYPLQTKYNDKEEWEEPYLGFVDHDSDTLLTRFLESENITLYEFVSDPKYVVIIDGDEYCVFNNLKDSGLIDTSAVIKEYCNNSYSYDFVHEGDAKR